MPQNTPESLTIMRFDILTIFPQFFESVFAHGVLERALRNDLAQAETHDLRRFTHDRHRTVDDRPFGGGEGMVLKAQPIFEAAAAIGIAPKSQRDPAKQVVLLLSASGKPFTQSWARKLATLERVTLICGRYEGIDERVSSLLCDDERQDQCYPRHRCDCLRVHLESEMPPYISFSCGCSSYGWSSHH